MKYLFSFSFLLICILGYAQDAYFSVGLGRGFLSSGDGRSWSLVNEYQHEVRNGRWLVGGGLSVHYSASDNVGINTNPTLYDVPYTIIDKHDVNPFGKWGESFDNQTGQLLDTKTEQHLYINFDLLATLRLGPLQDNKKWEYNISAGPSLNYISQTYIAQTIVGNFTSAFYPEARIRLAVPYYKRLLTVGGTLRADVLRRLTPKSQIGLSGRVMYNINSDAVYNYALLWRVGF